MTKLTMSPQQHVIAAIRSEEEIQDALKSQARQIFLLGGDLCKLPELCAQFHKAKKQIFLHVELVDGLKGDESGLRYLASLKLVNGIISTRAATLKCARELGLLAIQRIFVIDSSALKTGVQHAQLCKPDFVEVLPGISPRIIKLAIRNFQCPVIAGGLISTEADVETALQAGAVAVSTSHSPLWGR